VNKTFISNCGRFQFTIKPEFELKKMIRVEDWSVYELMSKFDMSKYLDNPSGPAILNFTDNNCEYWIEGEKVSPEKASQMHHEMMFTNEFNMLLKED
jgi:hypothetical protein